MTNDQLIRSQITNQAYRDGWERIFLAPPSPTSNGQCDHCGTSIYVQHYCQETGHIAWCSECKTDCLQLLTDAGVIATEAPFWDLSRDKVRSIPKKNAQPIIREAQSEQHSWTTGKSILQIRAIQEAAKVYEQEPEQMVMQPTIWKQHLYRMN